MPPAALPGPGLFFYDETAISEWQARLTARTMQKLEKLLPPDCKLWSEPEYIVGFDFAVEGILKAAAERKVGLIAVGANRPMSARVSAHALGAVTYQVIRHANCPVLTVRA